jgi:uncharacterized protein involved in exopolysaccharide biosynthesis
MSDPIDDYANRLTQALRQRGIDDPRVVSESREHLLDMVAEGRRRGLSLDEAGREAFDRFGAPEIVAAHAVSPGVGRGSRSSPGGDRLMSRLAAALDTIWQRKWWILVPAGVAAMVTTVAATYLLPMRYRSEAVIRVLAPRVPAEFAAPIANRPTQRRFQEVAELVLSRTRLERIIMDFGLYDTEAGSAPASELVAQMRDDVAVTLVGDDAQSSTDDGFMVSFVAQDPKTAQRVTERIASLFIEENLRDSQVMAEGVTQFVEARIYETRNRIVEYEKRLEGLRAAQNGQPLSRADLLPYEVLQESYRTLLTRAEEARRASDLERRQIGQQFRVIEAPRLPEEPDGPSRVSVSAWGAFAGVGVGLLLVGLRSRSTETTA